MRGVIYARYSSENQREESIECQIRENMAYAKKNGIEIVGTYIDRAVSAKTDKRDEFQRMIKDSSKKGFDVVIVWGAAIFARGEIPVYKIRHDTTQVVLLRRDRTATHTFRIKSPSSLH